MATIDDRGGPRWWLRRLEKELGGRQGQMQQMNAYYVGDHPLPFLTKAHNAKIRDEFRQLLESARSNFMRLVVDAAEERLRVEGFRLSATGDALTDQESWRIWQANQMDAESQTAFIEALVKGVCYLSVWAGEEFASIAVEDPLETVVAYTPGSNYRARDAALKVWADGVNGVRRATVYLPDGIYRFEAPAEPTESRAPAHSASALESGTAWKPLGGDVDFTGDAFVRNPLGVVPIVPLRNRPRLLCEGESELADVYRSQNLINGQLFLRCLAGYFGAHRQRWAVGLTLHEDEKGNPVEPFDVAIDRLWSTENPETKFGEFEQTDLSGYIKAIEQDVLHIAVTSRTPRHYLIEQGQSPSGDAIRSAEAGLVAKVRRKMRPFGEGLEEAVRLARLFQGEEDAPVDSEIVWADPQTRTEAETTDAVIKQFQAGLIPLEAAQAELGYTQTEIARFRSQRAADELEGLLRPPAAVETDEVAV
jgi:hypothetical protein